MFVRQEIVHDLRALAGFSAPKDASNQRRQRCGSSVFADHVADFVAKERFKSIEAAAVDGLGDARERIGMAKPFEAHPERPQGIDHSGISGKIGKCRQEPYTRFVGDQLVVDQAASAFNECFEHLAIFFLTFVGMRKKQVQFFGKDGIDIDFFESKDDICGVQVFLEGRSRMGVILIGKDTFVFVCLRRMCGLNQ